ncbi:hypothetical protein QTP70_022505 [Hemibagrus guttatus]|uniref:Uncharacterized protein n=1 Tax=Hemibagrus guttatus TaxID=175788 RepID=A0AAE0QAN7_9TELE|nr:hypothetical protein QTP70_022505 [Hemibagrus guttatus]
MVTDSAIKCFHVNTHYNATKYTCIIPFHCLYRLSDLFSGHGEPVPISGIIGHQGRIHPGRSANPSQVTHTLSFTHAITHYGQFRDSNQPRSMSLDCGRKPEYPVETHQAWGEHANSTHTVSGSETRTQDSGGIEEKPTKPLSNHFPSQALAKAARQVASESRESWGSVGVPVHPKVKAQCRTRQFFHSNLNTPCLHGALCFVYRGFVMLESQFQKGRE